jgi:hypothetical protein
MLKKILIVISVLAIFLASAEILLRFQGLHPGPHSQGLQIQPNHLLVFDSLLGLKVVPGKYEVTLLNKQFAITIDSDRHRITGPKNLETDTG